MASNAPTDGKTKPVKGINGKALDGSPLLLPLRHGQRRESLQWVPPRTVLWQRVPEKALEAPQTGVPSGGESCEAAEGVGCCCVNSTARGTRRAVRHAERA